MKTKMTIVALAALTLSPLAVAQQQSQPPQTQTVPAPTGQAFALPPVQTISGQQAPLDAKEWHGLSIANQWKGHEDKPTYGEDGSVKYLYGATLPTLVCAPTQVCAIKLQAGEQVNDVHAGDTTRWKITPATVGGPDGQSTMIVVKPTDSGLTTDLLVTTDRRVYTIKLASRRRDWMPLLTFDYPDEMQQAWANFKKQQTQQTNRNTLVSQGGGTQNIAALNFKYTIQGDDPAWRPIRVYDDGSKTYIQFDKSFDTSQAKEAPTLLTLGRDGGWFHGPSQEEVNYRPIGDRYVVDGVIDRAILVSGVGSRQTKVEIDNDQGNVIR